MLRAERVSVRYGNKTALSDVSLEIRPGQWWILAGPNGAGKTTLAGALSRGVPFSGSVTLDGVEISGVKQLEFARKVGILSQINDSVYDFTAFEVVEMGRYAHRGGLFRGKDPEGAEKIAAAMALTETEALRDRRMATLSGGERQRVFLAQVIAQDPKLLILDEPANHLDLPFQRQLFDTVGAWLRAPGRAVVTVMHDLTAARRYGTHALLLSGGRAVAAGPAEAVLTRDNLRAAYGMDVWAWLREAYETWA